MREDMAQIIIERPRHGHGLPTKGKGYDRATAKLGWDDAVKREGMKVRGRRGKHLNENLAPLRRYLAGQVGRPWVNVHADICRHLDCKNPVQDHVRDHLKDFVAVDVTEVGDQVVYADGHRIGYPVYSLFYVCPRSGILKKTRRPTPPYRFRDDPIKFISLGDGSALVRNKGVWLIVQFEAMPPQDPRRIDLFPDCLQGRDIRHDEAKRIYRRAIYTVQMRLASKREVRRVVSSYPRTNVVRRS